MSQFTLEMLAQMAKPEGTMVFRYTLPVPLGDPPPQPVALLESPAGNPVLARLEVDPSLSLSFLLARDEEHPRVAKVDLHPLLGAKVLQFYLAWSEDEVRLHVGGADIKTELIAGSSAG